MNLCLWISFVLKPNLHDNKIIVCKLCQYLPSVLCFQEKRSPVEASFFFNLCCNIIFIITFFFVFMTPGATSICHQSNIFYLHINGKYKFNIFHFFSKFNVMEFIINFVGVTVNRFCLNLVELNNFFFMLIYIFHICIININQSHTNNFLKVV